MAKRAARPCCLPLRAWDIFARAWHSTPPSHHRATGLVDVLDRVLDKGLVIAGDIKVSLAEVELLTIRIRLLVCSLDKAQEIGLDWWRYDRDLSPGAQRNAIAEHDELRAQIQQLERKVDALTRGAETKAALTDGQIPGQQEQRMAVERAAGGTSLIDVLDRVLDKGIVIDAWVRVSLVGIDLITVEARVVVASIDTYLKYSEAVGQVSPVSRPQAELTAHQNVLAENVALRAEVAAFKVNAAQESRERRWRRSSGRLRGGAAKGNPWPGPPPRRPCSFTGVDMEAKLALLEFLLTNSDLQASARRAIDWLAAHAGVQQAVVAVAEPGAGPLLLVAEHGVSSAAIVDFALTRDDEGHPLVRAMLRNDPTYFDGSPMQFRVPIEDLAFHAVPLRAEDDLGAHGLLLTSASGPEVHPDVTWIARMLGRQVARLQSRQTLAETRFGQERMLLYSIINAVTDPILLTDTEGKLIIANTHAEKLFAAPEDASEGLAPRRRAEQHAVLGGAVDERGRRRSSRRAASCCWSIRSRAPTCCSSC